MPHELFSEYLNSLLLPGSIDLGFFGGQVSTVEFGKALYYPYIEFWNRMEWLKVAALYHDKLCRIVPGSYHPNDHDEVKQLFDTGFIENRSPCQAASAVAEEFYVFAADTLTNAERRTQVATELRTSPAWGRIHIEKMDWALARALKDAGLLRSPDSDVDWYEVEPVTGIMYMLFLAKKLAGALPLISDDPASVRLSFGTQSVRTPDGAPSGEKTYRIASAVLKTHVPMNPENIPMSEIIEIRKRYKDERIAFYNAIGALAKDFDKIRDDRDAADAIAHHEAVVGRSLEALRTKIANHQLALKTGLMGISVPSIAKTSGVEDPVALAGLGVISAGAVVWKHIRDVRSARLENNWSYLMTLSDELAPSIVQDHFLRLGISGEPVVALDPSAITRFKRALKRISRADF